MAARKTASRHDNVIFRFLLDNEDEVRLQGTALIRPGEMVLDISADAGGDGPYLIVGRECKHWYQGENSALDRDHPMQAKWALIGDSYVGIWVEHGDEWLFSFQLGKPTA